MEYLYIDESGEFERDAVAPLTSLVGGLVTTAPPALVLTAVRGLHADLCAHPALGKHVGERPDDLHGRDLLPALDDAGHVDAFWSLISDHLHDLPDVHLVAVHHLRDAEVLVGVAADRRAFNRYLRMWQTLVRNVVHLAPWPAPASPAEVTVCTAQRSLPLVELRGEDADLAAAYGSMQFADDSEGLRVSDEAQLPGLLRGVADRTSHALHARRLRSAAVDAPRAATWKQLEREPLKAGLMLADLACGLLRWTVDRGATAAAELRLPPIFRVAYDPAWARYEWLAEAAPASGDALAELLTLAVAPGPTSSATDVRSDLGATADAWLRDACRSLATSLTRVASDRPKLRTLLVAACQAELDLKAGAFPRCELVFTPGALAPSNGFDEQVARLTFANHAGRDVDRSAVRRLVEAHLDADAGLLLGRGEALAHLSVGLRDEFDYDEAVAVLEPWCARADRVLAALGSGARWTAYGRVTSCLAQNLAYRQHPGDAGHPSDLVRACALARVARPHLSTESDLAQWACHAGNLGVVAADDDLLRDALTHLFGGPDVPTLTSALEGARFTRHGPAVRLFAFTVVSRAAALGHTPLCQALRDVLADPTRWRRLVDNVRDAPRHHPLELYARHLLELAPSTATDAEVAEVLDLSLDASPGAARVPSLGRAATLAVHARRLFSLGQPSEAQAAARRAHSTFLRPFEHNEWCSPTTLDPAGYDTSLGWFTAAVRALTDAANQTEVDAFLARFRFEWR